MLPILLQRRSCRKFDAARKVEKEKLDEIILAGLHAPSGMGRQAGEIFVIEDPKAREKVVEVNARIMGMPKGGDPFYGAPIILLIAAKDCPYPELDGAAMMENMLLEATNQGLATCWIHRAKPELQDPEIRALFASFGFNLDGYVGVDHIALGYGLGEAPKEKVIREGRVHYLR